MWKEYILITVIEMNDRKLIQLVYGPAGTAGYLM
jgi:hypothetical protein